MTLAPTPSGQLLAFTLLIQAVTETVEESAEFGAPGGVLYGALMQYGVDLAQFETIMDVLVKAGKVVKRGDLYFPPGK